VTRVGKGKALHKGTKAELHTVCTSAIGGCNMSASNSGKGLPDTHWTGVPERVMYSGVLWFVPGDWLV
jgi:hypothetical protein